MNWCLENKYIAFTVRLSASFWQQLAVSPMLQTLPLAPPPTSQPTHLVRPTMLLLQSMATNSANHKWRRHCYNYCYEDCCTGTERPTETHTQTQKEAYTYRQILNHWCCSLREMSANLIFINIDWKKSIMQGRRDANMTFLARTIKRSRE